jgi:hypothetical protein
MENSKYLPVGSNIGSHYEIIDVLGDDDFEILYLVRDNHRKGSFFVLKELFLETFSSRNNESVFTIPEAEGVFDKRKKEIILEIDSPKKKRQKTEIKTYGYIKDNHTIYTIMEFTNNFSLESYLHFEPRDEILLPSLDLMSEKKKKKSFLFLKILIITVVIVAGLAFYAYKMLKEDRDKAEVKPQVIVTQTPIHHPALVSRIEPSTVDEPVVKKIKPKVEEPKVVLPKPEYIPVEETEVLSTADKKENIESKNSIDIPTPVVDNDAIYIDNETEEIPEQEEVPKTVVVPKIETLPLEEAKTISLGSKIETTHPTISLGTPIVKASTKVFTREAIKDFLDEFIASSATGSVEDIASQYDYHIDRYFSLKNVTQATIKKDKRRYNRKWRKREFTIKEFKILKKYQKDGTDYCDLKTTTKWKVSTSSGKTATGTSRGFMTIKKTANGYKVKSIYTIK